MSKTGVLYSHKPWLTGYVKNRRILQPQTVVTGYAENRRTLSATNLGYRVCQKQAYFISHKPWLQGMSKTGVFYSHKPWLQGMPKTGVLYQPQTVANRVCQKQAYFIVESWRVETLGFGYKFYSTTIFKLYLRYTGLQFSKTITYSYILCS